MIESFSRRMPAKGGAPYSRDMSDQQVPDLVPSAPRRRLSKGAIALIAAGSALVLAVAGAAAAFALAPQRPEAEAVETPTPIETPTPKPIATEEPVVRPAVRFDTDCTELVPESLVVAMLGAPADVTSNDPIASLHDAAEVQEGALSCRWGTGTWESSNLHVYLIPDVADIFAGYQDVGGVVDVFGDASTHSCDPIEDIAQCQASILVGDTWLGIAARGPFAVDELRAGLEEVAPQLVTTVRAVDVAPATWTSEPSALTSEYMWDESAPLVAEAFGMPDASPSGYDEIGPLAGIVWDRSGYSMVPFDQSDGGSITITTLPGGEWAVAELARGPGAVAVEIPGAQHATMSTNDVATWVCFATRGAGMCVSSAPPAADEMVAAVSDFVASLPGA